MLDDTPRATPGEGATTPTHVCGLAGYNGMIDPPCPACAPAVGAWACGGCLTHGEAESEAAAIRQHRSLAPQCRLTPVWSSAVPAPAVEAEEAECPACGYTDGHRSLCPRLATLSAQGDAAGPTTEFQNRIAELEDTWTDLLRELGRLATALGDPDEWEEADDSTLNTEFDPWDVLRKATADVAALRTAVADAEGREKALREALAEALVWIPNRHRHRALATLAPSSVSETQMPDIQK